MDRRVECGPQAAAHLLAVAKESAVRAAEEVPSRLLRVRGRASGLFANCTSAQRAAGAQEQQIRTLSSLGFSSPAARQALLRCGGDLERAAAWLLDPLNADAVLAAETQARMLRQHDMLQSPRDSALEQCAPFIAPSALRPAGFEFAALSALRPNVHWEGAEQPEQEGEEFFVTLEGGRPLGLVIDPATLTVLDVASGSSAETWNLAHPDAVVRPGDTVREVNGNADPDQVVASLCRLRSSVERHSIITLKRPKAVAPVPVPAIAAFQGSCTPALGEFLLPQALSVAPLCEIAGEAAPQALCSQQLHPIGKPLRQWVPPIARVSDAQLMEAQAPVEKTGATLDDTAHFGRVNSAGHLAGGAPPPQPAAPGDSPMSQDPNVSVRAIPAPVVHFAPEPVDCGSPDLEAESGGAAEEEAAPEPQAGSVEEVAVEAAEAAKQPAEEDAEVEVEVEAEPEAEEALTVATEERAAVPSREGVLPEDNMGTEPGAADGGVAIASPAELLKEDEAAPSKGGLPVAFNEAFTN